MSARPEPRRGTRHLTPAKVAAFADAASSVAHEVAVPDDRREAMEDIVAFLRVEAQRDEVRPVVMMALLALDGHVQLGLREAGVLGVGPDDGPSDVAC